MPDFSKSGNKAVYVSQNGRETPIEDLNSSHLANILRKMEKEARKQFEEEGEGSGASKWSQLLPENYEDLADEAHWRGIDWLD